MSKEEIIKSMNIPQEDQEFFKEYIDKWKGDDLLIPNLKVLSKLDLSKVTLSESECEVISISTSVSKKEMETLSEFGLDLVDRLESILINELAHTLNNFTSISIYKLVEDISISESSFDDYLQGEVCKMVMKSNVSFKD